MYFIFERWVWHLVFLHYFCDNFPPINPGSIVFGDKNGQWPFTGMKKIAQFFLRWLNRLVTIKETFNVHTYNVIDNISSGISAEHNRVAGLIVSQNWLFMNSSNYSRQLITILKFLKDSWQINFISIHQKLPTDRGSQVTSSLFEKRLITGKTASLSF